MTEAYPTVWAYEKACEVIREKQAEIDRLTAQRDALAVEAQNLLSRLAAWKADHLTDENFRDWDGHVEPVEARLYASLAKAKGEDA